MNKTDLEYRLIRGLPISYQNIEVRQPTIEYIDKIGLLPYLSMTYIFRMQKEHLELYDEIKDRLNGRTIFESLIIQEEILTQKEDFNIQSSMFMLLMQSLIFFFRLEDINRIQVKNDYRIVIYEFKNINGEIDNIPIFTLDDSNFDEFSELIRIICNTDVLEIESNKSKLEIVQYADPNVQKIYEDLIKQHLKDEDKKKEENNISVSDVIGAVCVNENTKYNFENISKLTIWQLFYQFTSMFEKENIETVKSQYTSGNFQFEKAPNLNWLNKVKVKLPKDNKTTK